MKNLFINTLAGFAVLSFAIGLAETIHKYPLILVILLVLIMPIYGMVSIRMFNELMGYRRKTRATKSKSLIKELSQVKANYKEFL